MDRRKRIFHIAQCAGGVDRYLRMLLSHMNNTRFEQILVCSRGFRKEDYEGTADRFIQIEMCNSLSPSADIKAMVVIGRYGAALGMERRAAV